MRGSDAVTTPLEVRVGEDSAQTLHRSSPRELHHLGLCITGQHHAERNALTQLGKPRRNGLAVRLEGRIMNLVNTGTVLLVDQRKYLNVRNTTTPVPADPTCLSCWTDNWTASQPTTLPNAAFGKGTNWSAPRRLLLSVLFDF